jgi:Glycosyltransferases involved in cell wall biogenesis
LYILIPAYEPTEKMLQLILAIKAKTDYKLLVVDDGSGKKFQPLFIMAETYGCTVLHHERNQGKGAALKTGFTYLLSINCDENVVCADSDGQHSVEDIVKIADGIDGNKREMVLGIRKFEGKVPFKSRFGNSVTAFLFGAATGMFISDTQTGLRGYPSMLLKWLCSIEGSRFEYELNLLLQAKENDIAVEQIPIMTIYDDNNKGTHFRPVQDSVRIYLPLLKFSFSSFTSAILDFILLFVFQSLTGSLFLGVILARVISSIFNYSINKLLVFKAKNISHLQSAPKYFSLVVVMMFLNYLLLSFMTNVLFINPVLSKLATELILYVMSYAVQKAFVFKAVSIPKSCPPI